MEGPERSILKKSTDGSGKGQLIIDDNNLSTTSRVTTVISTAVTNVSVGTVTIQNAGVLQINNSAVKIQVNGDWINTARQLISSGTVVFAGTIPQYVRNNGQAFKNIISSNTNAGGLIFTSSFTCSTFTVNTTGLSAGANIFFAGNSTFTISTFTITGALGKDVVLKSTTSTATWYLANTSTNSVTYAQVQDSSATTRIIYANDGTSLDLGRNTNWVFAIDTGVRYWVASGNSNWNNTANWAYTSGIAGGASVPDATKTVVFDGANSSNGNCAIDVAVNVASMSVIGSYSGIINTQNNSITIGTGGFNLANGSFVMGSSTESIAGNFAKSGGTFDAGTSTITFIGGTSTTLSAGTTSFYHLIVNKTGGSAVTLGGNLDVNGNFTISAGTLTAVGAQQINVAGNWDNTNGWFNAAQSTVTFDGSSGTQLLITGGTSTGKQFFDFYFTGASTVTTSGYDLYVSSNFTLSSSATGFDDSISNRNITVNGSVTMSNGVTSMGASTWTVSGNWDHRNVTTFKHNTSLLVMNGTGKTFMTPVGSTHFLYDFRIDGNITLGGTQSQSVNHNTVINGTCTISVGEILTIIVRNLSVNSNIYDVTMAKFGLILT